MAHTAERRVGGLTVTIVATVAALTLLGGLVGLPGARRAAPSSASATTRPAASLSAGLAQVQSIQGVFVPDGQSSDKQPVVDRVIFAVSSNGDSSFDVRYRPDYQVQRKAWRAALKADPHATVADSVDLQYAGALTRRVVVDDSASGLEQTKTWVVNPFTRKVIGVRYRYYRLFSTYALTPPRAIPYVWLLSHVLDTALATGQPRVTIQEAAYRGSPAQSATVFNRDGRPAYEALIDRQYGLTEQVTSLEGSRTLPGDRLAPYHLEDLQVNRPVAQSRFVMKPDYRYAPQGFGKPKPTDTPDKYGIDLDERPIPVADLARFTSSWTLLPTWLPTGYRLASAARTTDGQHLWLTYRAGLDELTVFTAGRDGSWIVDYDVGRGFVVQTWPSDSQEGGYGWAAIGDNVIALRGGAMRGWPAGAGTSEEPGRNFAGTVAFGVNGTAPVSTLRRIAASVRPAKPGPHLPGSASGWWPWLVATAALVALAFAWRRAAAGSAAQSWDAGRGPASAVAPTRPPSPDRHGGGRGRRAAVVAPAVRRRRALRGEGVAGAARHPDRLPGAVRRRGGSAGTGGSRAPTCHATLHDDPPGPRDLCRRVAFGRLSAGEGKVRDHRLRVRGAALDQLPLTSSQLGLPLPGPGLWLAIAGALLIVVGGFAMRTRRPATAPEP